MTTSSAYSRRGPALLPSVIGSGAAELLDDHGDDATKPFVIGYIDAAQLPDEAAIAQARAQLSEYAIASRLQLGSIYVDQPGGDGSMFRALLASIERYNPAHVLVPSLEHVAPSGRPAAENKQQHIETRTGATVRPVGT